MVESPLQKIANIFEANNTLQRLFLEFEVIYEDVYKELIEAMLAEDDLVQANTVLTLAENSDADADIAQLNEDISTALGLLGSIPSPHEDYYRAYTSSQGTQYTYFLKWIYFCYKYFNEEQFFFNQLLDHLVPRYDAEVISSTTNLKIYFDGLGILLDTLDQKISDIYNVGDIDSVDEAFLQHIAQLLGYQKEDFSIVNVSFREIIKNLVDIYQVKGTNYSAELFFKFLGFDIDLREYYWDRDAQNPEGFASITNHDILYYLTTQDPRTRVLNQQEDMSTSSSQQPIKTSDWNVEKDLAKFSDYLSEGYSVDEILGFKQSDIPAADRFTYFKTNFINFRLIQYYERGALTNSDTETILKYIKFLSPIYVSTFVEVVTVPWEDFFEMENTEWESVTLEGDPGTPPWVDMLLPFLYVALRDYIPLVLSPPDATILSVITHPSTDQDINGNADSALPIIFGDPDHEINLVGTITLSTGSTYDLSQEKYINLRVDEGRGILVQIAGSSASTYGDLVSALNTAFTGASLTCQAVLVANIFPDVDWDIRIESDDLTTTSKIYLIEGLEDDLFNALGTTLETPVNGHPLIKGYQDFGLEILSGSATGLSAAVTYKFYINIDNHLFTEIDCDGVDAANTTVTNMVDAINNHYTVDQTTNVAVASMQHVSSAILRNERIAIAYYDPIARVGKLEIYTSAGAYYLATTFTSSRDVSQIAIGVSQDPTESKFVIVYNDVADVDPANWDIKFALYSNDGIKLQNDVVVDTDSPADEIICTTMSDNRIAVIYSYPLSSRIKFINPGSGLIDATYSEWYRNASFTNIDAATRGTGITIVGNTGSGGTAIFLDYAGNYALGSPPSAAASTKTFIIPPNHQTSYLNAEEIEGYQTFISFRREWDQKGYTCIFNQDGSIDQAITEFTTNEVLYVSSAKNLIGNVVVSYLDNDTNSGKYIVFNPDGSVAKKIKEFYIGTFNFLKADCFLNSNGDMLWTFTNPSQGFIYRAAYFGNVAEFNTDNKLQVNSPGAGEVWNDNVENYADLTDFGHYFIGGWGFGQDRFSEYYRSQGVDFTAERNRYSTFWQSSPDDDLIPLIEESLAFQLTIIISVTRYPYDKLDKVGDYIRRNGYQSRMQSQDVEWDNTYQLDINEISNINVTDTTLANFLGVYFTIYDTHIRHDVWFDTTGSDTLPAGLIYPIMVDISAATTLDDIATAIATTLDAETGWSSASTTNPAEITHSTVGDAIDIDDGTAGGVLTTSVTTQGVKTVNNWDELKEHYTEHLDVNEDIKNEDIDRMMAELSWLSWKKGTATYAEWTSWNLALDRLRIIAQSV